MIELTLEDLKQLLSDGRHASQYAWDHYEELAAREAVYTLYGPYWYGIGAAMPWGRVPKRARNLTQKTRRQKYIIYELDSEYKLVRARQVFNSVNDNTYECFELDGVQYACPFAHNRRQWSGSEVIAVGCKEEKPYYLGFLRETTVIAEFFEYVSQEKVYITEYSYNPVSKYTLHGYLTDPDAPINALNAAATRICWEEEPVYTDFSQWFRKPEENA